MIYNENIKLLPIKTDDTDFVLSLRNDLEIARRFFSDPPVYESVHTKWLSQRDEKDLDFIIWYEGSRSGRTFITHVNYRHSKAEYGIVIHPDYRGRNIAFRASQLLINYVFKELPIRKLSLQVFADNNIAIRLYEKLGFSREGLLKQEYLRSGVYQDVLLMALFKENWG